MSVIVSSRAEHRTGDYRFARQRSDRLPLEITPPLSSIAALVLRGFCALAFIGLIACAIG